MVMAEDKGDHLQCQQFVDTNKSTIKLQNNLNNCVHFWNRESKLRVITEVFFK